MKDMVCIVCPVGCRISVDEDSDYEVTGNKCPKGASYGKKELTFPTRIITSSEIPKNMIFDVMRELNKIEVVSPIKVGDVILENVLNTGVNIVASRDM